MNKTTNIHTWNVILVSLAALTLAGCGVMAPTIMPTLQLPTAVSPYIHYTPPEGFNIHLEFDYQISWVFSGEKRKADIVVLGLADPRFRTLPTPSSEDFHPSPNDFGGVVIWIFPVELGRTLDAEVEALKQGNSGTNLVIFLNDYKIKIDEYDARVLEYQISDPESYTSLMFERSTFFVVENQIYRIVFTIAEKDRGGEFEKGYEYFFNSLKIVP